MAGSLKTLVLLLLAAPIISPEQRTLPSPPAPTGTAQAVPAIAFDGTEFVVAWTDQRLEADEVFAARVMPGLTLLDPVGIDVAVGSTFKPKLGLACAPSGTCLLVWSDVSHTVRGARLANGSLLDPGGVPLLASAVLPSVAWDGAAWQVAAEDLFNASLKLARVTPAAGVTVGTPISGSVTGASIACIANVECLVAWMDASRVGMMRGRDVVARRLSQMGTVLDATDLAVDTGTGDQVLPSVTADTSQFLVGYIDQALSSGLLRRVTQAGQVDASPKNLGNSGFIVTGYDGTNFVALWEQGNNTDLGRFSSTLANVGATQVLGLSASGLGGVTGAGGVARVALEQYPPATTDIFLYELASGAAVGVPLIVDLAPAPQTPANVSADGTGAAVVAWPYGLPDAGKVIATACLVPGGGPATVSTSPPAPLFPVQTVCGPSSCFAVWGQSPDGGLEIRASRISAAGALIDVPSLFIASDTSAGEAVAAWDGTDFQVVWPSAVSLSRRRFTATMAPIDAAPQALGGTMVPPLSLGCAASADGLACSTATFNGSDWSDALILAPLVPDGGFVNAPPFSTDLGEAHFPAAVPGAFFVTSPSPVAGLQFSAFDATGQTVPVSAAAPADPNVFGQSAAAFNGDALLVVWASSPDAGADRDVMGQLLNADLTARYGPFAIAASPRAEWEPHVAGVSSGGFVVEYRVRDAAGAQVVGAVWLSWCDAGTCAAPDAGTDGGASASDSGTAELDAGPPPVPDGGWLSPDGGMLMGSLPDGGFVLPGIVGDPQGPAECGRPWSWSPTITGDPPFAFALRGAVPDGAQVSATGTVTWTPPIAAPHEEHFALAVGNPGGGAARAVDLAVRCPERQYGVACGCGSGGPPLAGLLLLASGRLRRRRATVRKS